MLSVRNLGGVGGLSLKMEIHSMYYNEGSTSGRPMNMQSVYNYYNIINAPRSFIVYDSYTPITVDPEKRDWPV